jgi:hypothetical protein
MTGKEYFEEMPDEVVEYYRIMAITGGLMGLQMYNRCKEIVENNPKYFVWEHTYKSIPDEVHEAYLDEKNPDRHKPLEFKKIGSGNGILADIEAMEIPEFKIDPNFNLANALMDMIKHQDALHKKQWEQENADKKLWDKYYKKYKLEYRK